MGLHRRTGRLQPTSRMKTVLHTLAQTASAGPLAGPRDLGNYQHPPPLRRTP
jgi:hypothetical protein